MPRSLNEAQFRGLVRKLVREYVTDTRGDPHKDVHADPTAKAWDTGLDEMDSSDLSQAGPDGMDDGADAGVGASPSTDLGEADEPGNDEEDREMQFLRYVANNGLFTGELYPGGQSWKTVQRLLRKGDVVQSGTGYNITDSGLERVAKSPGDDDTLGEVDGDPHADVHADPTAKSWDTGLE